MFAGSLRAEQRFCSLEAPADLCEGMLSPTGSKRKTSAPTPPAPLNSPASKKQRVDEQASSVLTAGIEVMNSNRREDSIPARDSPAISSSVQCSSVHADEQGAATEAEALPAQAVPALSNQSGIAMGHQLARIYGVYDAAVLEAQYRDCHLIITRFKLPLTHRTLSVQGIRAQLSIGRQCSVHRSRLTAPISSKSWT
jgi:hypothetical protein